MNLYYEKMQKLTDIARLYYEEDKTQNDIAKIYGISRPLVSRMLKEAKDLGIVKIEIRSLFDNQELVLSQLQSKFNITGFITAKEEQNDNGTNLALAEKTLSFMKELKGSYFGIGWGTAIGVVVSVLEERNYEKIGLKTVCPLVGNSSVSNRNYHSNENVRIFAQHTGAYPSYLYTPAFAQTIQELDLIQKLENYKIILKQWEKLDIALVNIGNYPSVPDFASGARYGHLLTKYQTAGRLLAYYYDINGEIIVSDTDYAIQIPLSILKNCKTVIGICSSNVKPKALLGAMRTGLMSHVVATEVLLKQVLELARQ